MAPEVQQFFPLAKKFKKIILFWQMIWKNVSVYM